MHYPEPPEAVAVFSSAPMDIGLTAEEPYTSHHYRAAQPAHDYAPPMRYDHSASGASHYVDAPYHHYVGGTSPPPMYADDSDLAMPGSTLSTASASSSIMGSPLSHHGQPSNMPDWVAQQQQQHHQQLPCIVDSSNEYYQTGSASDYPLLSSSSLDGFAHSFEYGTTGKPCVDPALTIHAEARPMIISGYEGYPASAPLASSAYPHSPAYSTASQLRAGSLSPSFLAHSGYQQQFSQFPPPPTDGQGRRPSLGSHRSRYSGEQPNSGDESKEKQKCPHHDCGKIYKDLKAHMLTHQTERPEKCPIATCEYHVKGFARKYDKNRHTLTHYKGTMVCGFCPGSGSAAEKSFNRADVFKRHLTAVHGVEQTPPNSRRKAAVAAGGPNGAGSSDATSDATKLSGYAPDATGKCSTCSQTFSSAQDFYEHLDDCVLRIVQQEDPSEAINAKRLAEVENDRNVQSTLQKNIPFAKDIKVEPEDDASGDEDDQVMLDSEKPSGESSSRLGRKLGSPSATKCRVSPNGGVQKMRTAAPPSRPASVPIVPSSSSSPSASLSSPAVIKSQQRRGAAPARHEYPSSWGFDKSQMTVKKRVMAVFDGARRLGKDDLALSTEHEVRVQLGDGRSYVTDLDVHSLRRADGFLPGVASVNSDSRSVGAASAWGSASDSAVDEHFTNMLDFSTAPTALSEAA